MKHRPGYSRCPGNARHWFAIPGYVGYRSPVCVRCGAPNPRPLSATERRDYDDVMAQRREAKA